MSKPKGRTKKIEVRHENLNGEEIALQRKVTSFWAILFVVPFLLGFGRRWKRWKLLNEEMYEIEEKLAKKVDEISKLMKERDEIEIWLKKEKKDVNESTRQTRGFSAPFWLDVPVNQLDFKKHKWRTRPSGEWRQALNPKMFKQISGDHKKDIRERMGIETDSPRAIRTAYTTEDFKNFKYQIEDVRGDLDGVITYKEPQQKKDNNNNNNRNNNNNNNNRNNRNNRNNNDDEDDYS